MQTCVNTKNGIDPFSESSCRDINVKTWTESNRRNARNRTVSKPYRMLMKVGNDPHSIQPLVCYCRMTPCRKFGVCEDDIL